MDILIEWERCHISGQQLVRFVDRRTGHTWSVPDPDSDPLPFLQQSVADVSSLDLLIKYCLDPMHSGKYFVAEEELQLLRSLYGDGRGSGPFAMYCWERCLATWLLKP